MRPRLALLLDMVQGQTIADIGCDHGLLSEAMVLSGYRVIGTDLSGPSLEKARQRLKGFHGFEARLGDGFDPLLPGEVDCAIMAGMGATTICGILMRGDSKAKGPLLLMQPMSDVSELRQYLRENGFGIVQEKMVRENRRYYPVIAAQYAQGLLDYPDWMMECGPLLMEQRHPLMQDYLHWRLKVYGHWKVEKAAHIKEAIQWLAQ